MPKYTSAFYKSVDNRASLAAKIALSKIISLIHPKSLLDVGCGSGAWLETAGKLGVLQLHGVDLPESIEIVKQRFSLNELENVDLNLQSKNFESGRLALSARVDLVISLEVAEHLPPAASQEFVRSLTQCTDYVLFSAAQPGQGGTHHINERPIRFWVTEFEKNGFSCFDIVRGDLLANSEIPRFYGLNALLFVRNESAKSFELVSGKSPVLGSDLDDLRSRMEKLIQAILRFVPPSLVTIMSKFFRH